MFKTHLARDGRTLCARRIERFTTSLLPDPTSEIDCRLCRVSGKHFPDATPLRVETCDACDSGKVTGTETIALPDRFDSTITVWWHAWSACDLHQHDVFTLTPFRDLVALTVSGLTDDEYRTARGAIA